MIEVSLLERTFQACLAPYLLLAVYSKADTFIDKDALNSFSEALKRAASSPEDSLLTQIAAKYLDHYLPKSPWALVKKTAISTLLSLLSVLAIYTWNKTGLLSQLFSPGFLYQFVLNGFVVVFLLNYYSYSTFRSQINHFINGSALRCLFWLLADFVVKSTLFTGLTAVIYVLFATYRNAFVGDIANALRATPVTIIPAIRFENLTSVYIYSFILSSFPVFVSITLKLMAGNNIFGKAIRLCLTHTTLANSPIKAAVAITSVFSGLFCLTLFGFSMLLHRAQ